MKMVFFDIECACVHKTYAKICAFGYVVCDENFNILEKEDILINPNGKFELTDRTGEKGIKLPYEYENFANYPDFRAVYPRITRLLEEKNNCVLGHAVLNDIKYLNCETRRYKLPPFNFKFWDSQLMFMTHINDFSHMFGLEYIANSLGVEFTPHRAADDAYATMRIVQALCANYGCSFLKLAERLKITAGRIANGQIFPPQSKGYRRYNVQKKSEKAERSEKRVKFYNHWSRLQSRKSAGAFKGKTFTFSKLVEEDLERSVPLLDKIYAAGGKYSTKVAECDIYVAEEGDATARTKEAASEAVFRLNVRGLEEYLNG